VPPLALPCGRPCTLSHAIMSEIFEISAQFLNYFQLLSHLPILSQFSKRFLYYGRYLYVPITILMISSPNYHTSANFDDFLTEQGFSAVPSRVGQKRPGQPGEEDSPEGKRMKME